MTVEEEEPNEYGFAGEATAPQPERDRDDKLHEEAEAIAVPADDLTAPLGKALADMTEPDEDDER
jgi:hypothetical protein